MRKMDVLAEAIVILIVAAFVAGIGLAIGFEQPLWLLLSAAAFIVVYAG
jgi:hypothetical protein